VNKEELRALYRQIRLRMSRGEVNTKSRAIGRKLLNEIDWAVYKKVCAFTPIEDLNEVDIKPVVSRLEAQGLEVSSIEPFKRSEIPADSFDVILVPCLAFNERRHRLGWGGGWFDRFLARQPEALKIGLAYQESLIIGLAQEAHDIPLDMVITEERIY
jgi:5-formyltetrahydrofolate cyclo-ligase